MTEELTSRQCHVLDWLPAQVPADAAGQFFEVEQFLLDRRAEALGEAFLRVALGLLCYYPAIVQIDEKWKIPNGKQLSDAIHTLTATQRGAVRLLFYAQNVLLDIQGGALHLTAWNASDVPLRRLTELAALAGLALREGVS